MTLDGYLTTKELAARWNIAPKTLANRRSMKMGVKPVKVGWLVFYKLADVVAFEKANKK